MKEKNVLITGASRGIGRETARIFRKTATLCFSPARTVLIF